VGGDGWSTLTHAGVYCLLIFEHVSQDPSLNQESLKPRFPCYPTCSTTLPRHGNGRGLLGVSSDGLILRSRDKSYIWSLDLELWKQETSWLTKWAKIFEIVFSWKRDSAVLALKTVVRRERQKRFRVRILRRVTPCARGGAGSSKSANRPCWITVDSC